uniref:BTB domain-containing protein n=1 Tax=Setaria italica TaxID=4555 RepID=K3YYN9_SETIT
MYCIKQLKLHCASKRWDMACVETVTTFLRWAFETNCTQLQEKCMSLIALISPDRILTQDFVSEDFLSPRRF